MTYEFSFLGIGLKTRTRKSRKNFIFKVFLLKLYQIGFSVFISLILVTDDAITLFNSFSVIYVVSKMVSEVVSGVVIYVVSEFSIWPNKFGLKKTI